MSSFLTIANPNAARRLFLGSSGLLLSGAAVALLAGRDALAAKAGAYCRRRAHPEHGARCRARGDRRLPGGRGKRPAAEAGARSRGDVPGPSQGARRRPLEDRSRSSAASRCGEGEIHVSDRTLKTQADVLRFAATLEKGRSALISARCRCSAIAILPRPPRASSATRPCTGRSCATRSARCRFRPRSWPDMVRVALAAAFAFSVCSVGAAAR